MMNRLIKSVDVEIHKSSWDQELTGIECATIPAMLGSERQVLQLKCGI